MGLIVTDWILEKYSGIVDAIKHEFEDSTSGNIAKGFLFIILWGVILGAIYVFINLTWMQSIKTGILATGIIIGIILIIQIIHWIGESLS
jgi:hypothetical protein